MPEILSSWNVYLKTRTVLSVFSTVVTVFFSTSALPSQLDGYKIVSETVRTVTAYNVGDPNQTSGRPCLAASGKDICRALEAGEKICAANFVPLGTLLDIENVGICSVSDRTAERFENRVDIAMPEDHRRQAIEFGEQELNVKILKKMK